MQPQFTVGQLLEALEFLKHKEQQVAQPTIPKEEMILRVFNNDGVICFVSANNRLYRFKPRYHQGRSLKCIPGARLQTDDVKVVVIWSDIILEYGSSKFSQRISVPSGQVCEIYTNFRYVFKQAYVDQQRHKVVYR